MTRYYAELDSLRFHYDSEKNIASISKSCDDDIKHELYEVAKLSIEDVRTLSRYLQMVLELMEQRRWEETERIRCMTCHVKE